MAAVGAKVIALLKTDGAAKTVYSFGEGVYDGDQVVNEQLPGIKNPKITLADGKHVWGYECWWGESDRVRARYPAPEWTWVDVDIDEIRRGRS